MSQNGQTHFKNQDFLSVSDYFGPLCIKGLKLNFCASEYQFFPYGCLMLDTYYHDFKIGIKHLEVVSLRITIYLYALYISVKSFL